MQLTAILIGEKLPTRKRADQAACSGKEGDKERLGADSRLFALVVPVQRRRAFSWPARREGVAPDLLVRAGTGSSTD
jgi:hypothetical protein